MISFVAQVLRNIFQQNGNHINQNNCIPGCTPSTTRQFNPKTAGGGGGGGVNLITVAFRKMYLLKRGRNLGFL